jgi:hypothetical protein
MKISAYWLQRRIASCMVMFVSVALTAQVKPSVASPGPEATMSSARETQAEPPDNPVPVRSQASDARQPPGNPESSVREQQNGTEPVGTAAAPYEKPLGVAASRPAGAVMAPAKQRRTRTILIRVGLVAGAAVAIGTVVALSKTSPSRPN